ncbi:MAG: DUF1853 family protein [Mariniblastus sp.]
MPLTNLFSPINSRCSMMVHPSYKLTHEQAIRDLKWVLSSPSLVAGPQSVEEIEFDPSNLDGSAVDQLAKFCECQVEHKVGRYFENLVGFWLEHVRRVELIGKGIHIRDGNRTLGEIDFLFRDENGVMTHLESAVKFFLHFPNSKVSHYPGPNATDNFERKTEKLFGGQLAMSAKQYPDVTQRQAFMRGTIFYHPSSQIPIEIPSRMSVKHTKGVWIRESELEILDQWYGGSIAEKPFWLSATSFDVQPIMQLQEKLLKHFAGAGYPVMLRLTKGSEDANNERAFVVPDFWPSGSAV